MAKLSMVLALAALCVSAAPCSQREQVEYATLLISITDTSDDASAKRSFVSRLDSLEGNVFLADGLFTGKIGADRNGFEVGILNKIASQLKIAGKEGGHCPLAFEPSILSLVGSLGWEAYQRDSAEKDRVVQNLSQTEKTVHYYLKRKKNA